MALINCPECHKEISDRVKSCPHCGYPLLEELKEAQKVEVTSIKLKMDEKKKRRFVYSIIFGASVIILSIIVITAYNNHKLKKAEQDYSTNINSILLEMIASGAKAESLMNLTYKVWYNAIYENWDSETDPYTRKQGYFVSDFNVALGYLFDDNKIVKDIEDIKSSRENIASNMKKLQNPPKEYERAYETLLELFTAYQALVELAVSPKGSLTTYGTNRSERIDRFLDLYRSLETQLPSVDNN